ncbi:MAG: hypothetical protein MJ057_05940 [Sphaerochaetaceae bacterium]|nr:hypothetical protein [Sphaerochaetaceae bacterium]
MRKVLLISLTALICLPLFSLTQTMQIHGYYNSMSSDSSVDFKVTESVTGQNRNLLSSYVNLTDDYTTAAKEVFSWTLTGTSRNSASITFTFFPLQAYVNGYFYQPSYTITMTKNTTMIGEKTTSADNFKISGGASFSKALDNLDGSVYINGFNTENSIKYTGAVASNFPTDSQWIRSGTCKIQIKDYEKYIAGTFDYTCNVSVTYTVN